MYIHMGIGIVLTHVLQYWVVTINAHHNLNLDILKQGKVAAHFIVLFTYMDYSAS